jgi:amino acid transporter
MQALAANGMGPKLFTYIDRKGRPVSVVLLQLLFGCLAFINLAPNGGDIFTWLLSLSGLSILFIYGSIALAHIRFRRAWAVNGHSVDELPFKAAFGVWGSWVCLIINVLALVAQFYVALYPVGGPNLDPATFFELYLAGPFLIALYLIWKVYSWFVRPEDRPLYVKIKDIDIYTGMRQDQLSISGADVPVDQRRYVEEKKGGPRQYAMRIIRNVI